MKKNGFLRLELQCCLMGLGFFQTKKAGGGGRVGRTDGHVVLDYGSSQQDAEAIIESENDKFEFSVARWFWCRFYKTLL